MRIGRTIGVSAARYQAQIAAAAVRQAEEGLMLPSIVTTEKLAEALGVSPCWLAFGVGQGPDDGPRSAAKATAGGDGAG